VKGHPGKWNGEKSDERRESSSVAALVRRDRWYPRYRESVSRPRW